MCILCIEYNKGLMSFREMKEAIREQARGSDNDSGEDHSNVDVIEALAEEDEV